MTNEGFTFQLSTKFGVNDSSMLNVRANTADEFREALADATGLSGDLALCAETVRAVDVVRGAFPATEVIATTGPAAHHQPAQVQAAGPSYLTCVHGNRIEKSGGQGKDAWRGYFCPLGKNDPNRCKPEYPGRG